MSERPTSIRFPVDLRERIAERAAAERRSLSGQVLHLLDEALGPEPPKVELPGMGELVRDLYERGLDEEKIAASLGLDPLTVARALAGEQ